MADVSIDVWSRNLASMAELADCLAWLVANGYEPIAPPEDKVIALQIAGRTWLVGEDWHIHARQPDRVGLGEYAVRIERDLRPELAMAT